MLFRFCCLSLLLTPVIVGQAPTSDKAIQEVNRRLADLTRMGQAGEDEVLRIVFDDDEKKAKSYAEAQVGPSDITRKVLNKQRAKRQVAPSNARPGTTEQPDRSYRDVNRRLAELTRMGSAGEDEVLRLVFGDKEKEAKSPDEVQALNIQKPGNQVVSSTATTKQPEEKNLGKQGNKVAEEPAKQMPVSQSKLPGYTTAKVVAADHPVETIVRKKAKEELVKVESFFLRKHGKDFKSTASFAKSSTQNVEVTPKVSMIKQRRIQPRRERPQPTLVPDIDGNASLLDMQLSLGNITLVKMQNRDYLAGYGLKQHYYLRYSPPPISEPWPMPRVFMGFDQLFDIDPLAVSFNLNDSVSNCSTVDAILERYRSGLLFQSARQLAIEDAILHPGALYLDKPKNARNYSMDSFFERKVISRMNAAKYGGEPTTKWVRTGSKINPAITIVMAINCSHVPTEASFESYGLHVSENGITIEASEIWGVLYALETLSQLIFVDEKGNFMVRAATVEDFPRFRHRGLMLDSARHFLPVSIIKQNLDAMVQNKLNVFHWHLSDDQSFPLYLQSFPEFAKLAAFSHDEIYKPSDVREIVEYARLRGIRVVPEIDSPSHVFSWRHLPVSVLTRCYGQSGEPNGDVGPLDPTNTKTYEVLKKIIGDVASMFSPEPCFHAGGDEVPKSCWASNPNITEYRVKKFAEREYSKSATPAVDSSGKMISFQEVVAKYNRRLLKIFWETRPDFTEGDGQQPRLIMWEEAYENDNDISREVTIHVWKSPQSRVKFLIDEGYQVLFSQCWYLNYIKYGVDWLEYYECDPAVHGRMTMSQNDQGILGGEICMWGEYIDATNIMSTLWPRASAAAERLWSDRGVRDVAAAGRRLEEHRCRMMRRGIPAAPVSGPGTCGSSSLVSASKLWLAANYPRKWLVNNTDEEADEMAKVLLGEGTVFEYKDDLKAARPRNPQPHALLSVRVNYGVSDFVEIHLTVASLCLLWLIMILLSVCCFSTRRSGLKCCRPVVRYLDNSFRLTPLSSPSGSSGRTSSSLSDKLSID